MLGDDYKKYKAYNLTFPHEKTAYNDFCNKYSFGEIYFIVNKTKEYYSERYINSTSLVSQVYDIQENIKSESILEALKVFFVTFARKDNLLRVNRLVGLFENWVTRWQPFVFLSSSLLCFNVITLGGTKVQNEMQTKR